MSERFRRLVLLCAVASLALVGITAVGQDAGKAKEAELREYQGEKLDPISKFRENSIEGPQRVDIKAYRLKISGLVDKPLSLTYDEVLARPAESRVITAHCVEGWHVKILWEGV